MRFPSLNLKSNDLLPPLTKITPDHETFKDPNKKAHDDAL